MLYSFRSPLSVTILYGGRLRCPLEVFKFVRNVFAFVCHGGRFNAPAGGYFLFHCLKMGFEVKRIAAPTNHPEQFGSDMFLAALLSGQFFRLCPAALPAMPRMTFGLHQ